MRQGKTSKPVQFYFDAALARMSLDYLAKKVPQGRRIVQLQYIEGDSFTSR